jgi:hypothetical protein
MENLMTQIWGRFDTIDKHSKEERSRAKVSYENAMKVALQHYTSGMDEKFGKDSSDA